MKRQLTLDEWFYHWLANEEKYLVAAKFFLKIYDICDKIVLQKGTRLAHKFYQLDLDSGKQTPNQRDVVKFIKNSCLSNSLKIHWVNEVEDLQEGIQRQLPAGDIYLVKICCQTVDRILITTDQTLHDNLSALITDLHITPVFAEQFIEEYLSQ